MTKLNEQIKEFHTMVGTLGTEHPYFLVESREDETQIRLTDGVNSLFVSQYDIQSLCAILLAIKIKRGL